tara:strand:- start:10183 stop:10470 length:288 start_codon:yes stop_codon:yes gene_type:complete
MKVKLVALAALFFMMFSTSTLASNKTSINTLCKATIKSLPNDLGRVELKGFKRQDSMPVARYRLWLDGEIRQLNCVYDPRTLTVSIVDRKTGMNL